MKAIDLLKGLQSYKGELVAVPMKYEDGRETIVIKAGDECLLSILKNDDGTLGPCRVFDFSKLAQYIRLGWGCRKLLKGKP